MAAIKTKQNAASVTAFINKLADVDLAVLEQMLRSAYAWMQAKYPKGK